MQTSRHRTVRRCSSALLVALLGLTLVLPAQAQWKWRDKTGRTLYSDLPPPSSVAEHDILSRPRSGSPVAGATAALPLATAAATAASTAAKGGASAPLATTSAASTPRTVEPELEARRKKAEAEQAAKVKAEAAKSAVARAENCERAKGQMRSLDSGVRLVRTNPKGEREVLDDAQRGAEVQRTRNVIAADCG